MKNKKIACIFDLDGTIAETEAIHLESFNETFQEFGVNWNWSENLYKELLKIGGSKNRINFFSDKTNKKLPTALIEKITDKKTVIYQKKLMNNGINARSGVIELVNNLRGKWVIGIATNASEENTKKLLSMIWGKEISEIFSVISTPKGSVKTKPAPDTYTKALTELKIDPKNAVAIEDSEVGLESAKAAQIPTIVAPSKFSKGGDFTNADLVVNDLSDPKVMAFLDSL